MPSMTGSTNADLERAAAAAAAETSQQEHPSYSVREGPTGGATHDNVTTAVTETGAAASGDGGVSVAEAEVAIGAAGEPLLQAAAEPDPDAAQEVLSVESPSEAAAATAHMAAGHLPTPDPHTLEVRKQATTDEVPQDVAAQDVEPEETAAGGSATGFVASNAADSVPPGSTAPTPVRSNAASLKLDENQAPELGRVSNASNNRVEGGLPPSSQSSAGPHMGTMQQPLSSMPSSHLSAASSPPLEDHVADGGRPEAEASHTITQALDQGLNEDESADCAEALSDQLRPLDSCRSSAEGLRDDGRHKDSSALGDSRGEDDVEVGGTLAEVGSHLTPRGDGDNAAADASATRCATDNTAQGGVPYEQPNTDGTAPVLHSVGSGSNNSMDGKPAQLELEASGSEGGLQTAAEDILPEDDQLPSPLDHLPSPLDQLPSQLDHLPSPLDQLTSPLDASAASQDPGVDTAEVTDEAAAPLQGGEETDMKDTATTPTATSSVEADDVVAQELEPSEPSNIARGVSHEAQPVDDAADSEPNAELSTVELPFDDGHDDDDQILPTDAEEAASNDAAEIAISAETEAEAETGEAELEAEAEAGETAAIEYAAASRVFNDSPPDDAIEAEEEEGGIHVGASAATLHLQDQHAAAALPAALPAAAGSDEVTHMDTEATVFQTPQEADAEAEAPQRAEAEDVPTQDTTAATAEADQPHIEVDDTTADETCASEDVPDVRSTSAEGEGVGSSVAAEDEPSSLPPAGE